MPGRAFARALTDGTAYDELAGPGGGLTLVEGDELPDVLHPRARDHLRSFPSVVVALVADPARQPGWADLAMVPGDPALDRVAATVRGDPLAATTLALLLRGSESRSIPEGLVAESTAYGLLQSGPEFARWRAGRPRVDRPGGDGPAVLVERSADELEITLNRPRVRNALDAAMRDGLDEALRIAALDPAVSVVHLRGAGSSFCSGGDLDEFGTRSDPVSAHLVRLMRSPARALATVGSRAVAHLHGDAVGSGIELAAFARRVDADPGTRISLPEVRFGLIPGAGGTVSLPRRIGRHRTLLLALGIDVLAIPTALEWGLVDAVSG